MGVTSGQFVCRMPLSVLSRPVRYRTRSAFAQRSKAPGAIDGAAKQAGDGEYFTFPKEDPLADFPDHFADGMVESFGGSRVPRGGEGCGVQSVGKSVAGTSFE